jgi:UDP-3-O-[3-hydroxymyristoyl] glucosamine N-acyltransferase
MILYNDDRPLMLIGYDNSTIMQEARHWFQQEIQCVQSITPEAFDSMSLYQRLEYQYGLAFTLDQTLRRKLLNDVVEQGLQLISYVHPTATLGEHDAVKLLSPGCFVAPYSTILLGSHLGAGCIVESYCLVSHHVTLGTNCHLHSGVMIAGRCTIGSDCTFNFRSTVLPKLDICSDVELGAVSTVSKSIMESGRYVGTPCRRMGDRMQ